MPWYENRRGEQLWYEDRGEGCPLVLIHGWCMSSAVWKYQYAGLSDSYRLIAPDLRGHGRSNGVTGAFNFGAFADDLVDLCRYLDLSGMILIGWSMGGQILLQSHAELSARSAGLVLVSSTPRFVASDDFPWGVPANEAAGMRLKVQRNLRRALDGFYSRLFADGEYDNDAATEIITLLSSIPEPDIAAALGALDALADTDMRQLLATVNVPTLILNGDQDRVCLPQASEYLKDHISGAEQKVFLNCGHAPFLSQSDVFNAELVRFARSFCAKNI